ncbi:hypothetical protein CPC08DRAFT_716337 [Agrocybe pediades]|nr:hypothetical protein CPC08DRAFT_716337 [Agrocybe pediades]
MKFNLLVLVLLAGTTISAMAIPYGKKFDYEGDDDILDHFEEEWFEYFTEDADTSPISDTYYRDGHYPELADHVPSSTFRSGYYRVKGYRN